MAQSVLNRKTGVIVVFIFLCLPCTYLADRLKQGDDVLNLLKFCHKKSFAIPAINVTSSSTVVAALEAARDKKSPIILQMSQGATVFMLCNMARR